MKKIIVAIMISILALTGCGDPFTSAADTANRNLSEAAENFEVPRRIVGINGITDNVLFTVEGFCSYETDGATFEAICLVERDPDKVERVTLGLSDNVTFVSTQLGAVGVDLFRPRVIFRPQGIIPNFDLSTRGNPTEPVKE
jgi:protein involved in sex pheromone biosynthesis